MVRLFWLAALWICFMMISVAAGDLEKNGWKLIWQDEFNGKKLDGKKWNVLLREQSKHNELQYYVPDEVYVENGYLRIRSRIRCGR